MKAKILLVALLLFGFSVVSKAETLIPTPFFYQISKHLLHETQNLVGDSKNAKVKPVKNKDGAVVLKCQAKKEQRIKNFGVLELGAPRSLWKIDSDN